MGCYIYKDEFYNINDILNVYRSCVL